jgi:hypothetical protein
LSVSLRTNLTPGMLCIKPLSKTSLLPVNSQATSMICSASTTPGTNHCASTSDVSRICASRFLGSPTTRLLKPSLLVYATTMISGTRSFVNGL